MNALQAMLTELTGAKIPVLMYVAPIRQDQSLPYDRSEYETWKAEVAKLAVTYHAHFMNLEQLVPGNLWGTYHKDDVDFFHFQGEGHRILGGALQPEINLLLKKPGG